MGHCVDEPFEPGKLWILGDCLELPSGPKNWNSLSMLEMSVYAS